MKWILIVMLILFVIIFCTNVKIFLEYRRERENDMITIQMSIWFGLIRFKYQIPMLQINSLFQGVKVNKQTTASENASPKKKRFRITPQQIHKYIQKLRLLKLQIHDLNEIAKQTLRKFHCEEWEWRTRVGLGDAATTGVVTGVIWAVKANILGIVAHYIHLSQPPRLDVIPTFQDTTIDTHIRCILRFRVGNAIIAGTRILMNLRKGREGKWQSTLFRA
ncbi:MAG TPA: DUF2953 domain-containing protein [Bacillota bacterium]|nr:DUF2953 domain-containing protein [Bacillota bacterium]